MVPSCPVLPSRSTQDPGSPAQVMPKPSPVLTRSTDPAVTVRPVRLPKGAVMFSCVAPAPPFSVSKLLE